jgi:hypothetical protein
VSNDLRKDSVLLESKKSVSSDLESSRKKFQRGMIEDRETVDLWEAALRMLVYARAILLQKKKGLSASADKSDSSAKPPHTNSSTVLASSNKPELTSSSRGLFSTDIRLSATDCTNLLQKHGSSVHRSLIEERDARARPKITSANIVLCGRGDRNTRNVGDLSDGLWQRIIACAAGTEGILSLEQQKKVIHWGEDRADLGTEGELSGKGQSVQIWNVLEKMGCLTYEIKA